MQRDLTYFAPRNCYKKKRNAQTYYVGKGSDRDSDENYRRAWAEWEAKLTELVAQEKAERIGRHAPALLAMVNSGRPDADLMAAAGIDLEPRAAEIIRAQQAEGRTTLNPDELAYTLDLYRRQQEAKSERRKPAGKTLAELADQFLTRKASQARTGQRSGGRYANLRSYLYQFRDFAGADCSHVRFTPGEWLSNYHERQLELIDAGEISTTAASDRLQVARQFVRWLWENNWCDLPRNLESRELTISRTVGNVEPMPAEVLRRRVRAAAGRMKSELLLMANCGMYQGDTAALLHTQLDLDRGTITRKRSKTKNVENVPTVTYHLWPSTLELLKRHASQTTPEVLINRNGVAGVRTDVREDGTVARTDNSASTYDRLQDSLARQYAAELADLSPAEIKARTEAGELEPGEDDGPPQMRRWVLKSIRKAGATAIGNHPTYGRFADYYLGHAPNGVAATHYVRPDADTFRDCCQWLGRHLELFDLEQIGTAQDEPTSAADPEAAPQPANA